MAIAAKKLTYEDYEKIPADDFRHEIVGGEEFMTPAPGTVHQRVITNLTLSIGSHVRQHQLGRVFVAPTDVVLSKHDIVEPDVIFVSTQRTSIVTEKNIQGAPDLVIEVLSPSTAAQDRGPKRDLYERSGVAEYWMVDLAARTVEVHEFGARRRRRIYKEGQSFESALFPGLTLSVDEILS